jgi:hypothetical protein
MKVALVLAPVTRRVSAPYELAMTAAVLRAEGHEVGVFDVNNDAFNRSFREKMHWKYTKYGRSAESQEEIFDDARAAEYAAAALADGPDAVVFQNGTRNYQISSRLAAEVRRRRPGTPLVLTGFRDLSHSQFKEELTSGKVRTAFDHLIWGETEAALPRLLRRLSGGSPEGDASRGPIVKDLDELPFHDFRDYDLDSYAEKNILELQFSRSCNWSCYFCTEWLMEKPFRAMSGRRLYEEIACQAARHPSVHRFRFDDKTINGDMATLETFAKLMAEGKLGRRVFWYGSAMLREEMADDLLALMARAGCVQLDYGLETGSDRLLADMNKPITAARAEKVLAGSRRHEIRTSVNIVLGYPTETDDDFEKTLAFVRRNRDSITRISLAFPGCRINPGSFLHTNRARFGIRWADPLGWEAGEGNDFRARIARLRRFCETCIELDLEVGLHGRLVRTPTNLKDLLEELTAEGRQPAQV